MSKILVVEDEVTTAKELKSILEADGWSVEVAHTGKDALQILNYSDFTLIILDWNLPDITGLDVCAQYRRAGGSSQIIFITGQTSIDKKEQGLDSGADDYLTKPFEVRELQARIRALMRRPAGLKPSVLSLCGITLDRKARCAITETSSIALSVTEASILEFLMDNPDQSFSAADVFRAVWPSDSSSSDHTVRSHMRILRKKLEMIGHGTLITTVARAGYMISTKK